MFQKSHFEAKRSNYFLKKKKTKVMWSQTQNLANYCLGPPPHYSQVHARDMIYFFLKCNVSELFKYDQNFGEDYIFSPHIKNLLFRELRPKFRRTFSVLVARFGI